jgi:plastocyanin
MRLFSATRYAVCVLAFLAVSCGGGSNPSPSPSPTPTPTPTPSGAGQVNIVGNRGNTSFNPNPVNADANRMAVWTNTDGVVHRIVANDGSFDTGNINPGAASGAIAVAAAGANYHCSIHPSMIGVVNDANGQTPPCTGNFC